jgi:RNA polymerase sigma factor (sigma-70 family)
VGIVKPHAGAVLGHLDRLFHRGTVAGLTEGALLERYVLDRDEAAFAALVARHGPMVLGVCRRILRDERDVEDAFQATFLILVRRAGAIRDGDLVGRWLHGVAHRVAVRARAQSARRFVHEQSTDEPVEPIGASPASAVAERRELSAIVDEEVARLPSNLRAPVVLCYLEGMSHDEAARRLRWPVGTVRSRMARARDVLRRRLARRGVTAEGAAIVSALGRVPVPPEWLDATVRIAWDFATRTATAAASIASVRPVALSRRVLQTMVIAKLSYVGAAALGLVMAIGGVRTLAFQGRPATPPIRQAPDGADPAPGSRTDDRIAAMSSVLSKVETELKRSGDTIALLQDQLRAVRGELDTIRRDQRRDSERPPTPVPPTRGVRTTLAKGAEGADRGRGPRYISLNPQGRIVVISPDGARLATYSPGTLSSTPLKLPPILGVRREVIITPLGKDDPRDIPPTGVQMDTTTSPWFFAMDLDGDNKVTRIAAFNVREGVEEGKWIEEKVPEPVDRSTVRNFETRLFAIGHRVCAFGMKSWGVLELPSNANPRMFLFNGRPMVENGGRLYHFDPQTATWNDIYAGAVGADPADPSK